RVGEVVVQDRTTQVVLAARRQAGDHLVRAPGLDLLLGRAVVGGRGRGDEVPGGRGVQPPVAVVLEVREQAAQVQLGARTEPVVEPARGAVPVALVAVLADVHGGDDGNGPAPEVDESGRG